MVIENDSKVLSSDTISYTHSLLIPEAHTVLKNEVQKTQEVTAEILETTSSTSLRLVPPHSEVELVNVLEIKGENLKEEKTEEESSIKNPNNRRKCKNLVKVIIIIALILTSPIWIACYLALGIIRIPTSRCVSLHPKRSVFADINHFLFSKLRT